MTTQDIALFKSYIEANTLREIFIRGYRKGIVLSKNPSSIEEYLSTVDPEEVIKKAITNPIPNSNYGYDFWYNANENWLVFLHKGRRNHSYTDYHKLIELDGMFKILRENWDAAKAWLYEDVNIALKRMGLLEENTKEKSEEDMPDVDTFSGVPEYDDGLEFFDVESDSRCRTNKLKKGQVSLNFRSHSFKVTFNQEDTKKLQQNGYKYVRLAKNKQGDIVIQLHKVEGLTDNPINLTFPSSGGSTNAAINSKYLCEKLKTLLNLSGEYFLLKIEELYMDADKANYKISK